MKKSVKYLRVLAAAWLFCFALTGCGNSDSASTSGNNDNNLADDVGNAADDVADGVGNAVDDLVGNGGFDNYNDAHDYFMDTMGSYHSDAAFELRDEDKNLNNYQEGSKGYRFNLYDTSNDENGELFGEFYVDATSGTIYRRGSNNAIEEYPGNNGSGTTNGSTGGTGTTNSSTGGTGATNGSAGGSTNSSVSSRANNRSDTTGNKNVSSNTTR